LRQRYFIKITEKSMTLNATERVADRRAALPLCAAFSRQCLDTGPSRAAVSYNTYEFSMMNAPPAQRTAWALDDGFTDEMVE
jgi:hypothetical protein